MCFEILMIRNAAFLYLLSCKQSEKSNIFRLQDLHQWPQICGPGEVSMRSANDFWKILKTICDRIWVGITWTLNLNSNSYLNANFIQKNSVIVCLQFQIVYLTEKYNNSKVFMGLLRAPNIFLGSDASWWQIIKSIPKEIYLRVQVILFSWQVQFI